MEARYTRSGRMLAYFDVPISWGQVLKRTLRRVRGGDAQERAAQLAYFFTLALFPALICLVALASLFPLQNLTDDMTRLLQPVMPAGPIAIIRQQMLRLADSRDTGVLGLGLAFALWSSSSAMSAIITTMNRAYAIDETRPWWRVRVTSILLTVGLAFFFLVSLTLILAGPAGADLAARWLRLGPAAAWTWRVAEWPLVVTLIATGIRVIYHFAPDADQTWVWITPGSALATTLSIAGSLGFRYYVVRFGQYDVTYGAIGGMIVLLLWFYVTGLALVAGIELDAVIEHASPRIREPQVGPAGARRRIGAPWYSPEP